MNTSYKRLTLADREQISQGIYAFETFAAIARRLNRPTSAVSNEVWRNVKYSWCYRAEKAQERSNEKKKKGRPKKLDTNDALRRYVYEKQYFPKGTDFREIQISNIKEAERRLNSRPRKVLDYYTPSEKFYQLVAGRKIALETWIQRSVETMALISNINGFNQWLKPLI